MKAMVLAAGLGTRLRPLTERWPKPAMPFLGSPLLRYTLKTLSQAGVTSVGFNTHHLPEVMEVTGREEARRAGMETTFVHEPLIQGTGGGIRGLKAFLEGEETFVVFNGDILFPVALAGLIREHRASHAAATLLLLPLPASENYAAVEMDGRGRVLRIAGHGPGGEGLSPWHFSGVHVMSPAVFDFMRPSGVEDINREVYPRMMEAGLAIHGAKAQGYWSDLGTPSRYLATQAAILENPSLLAPLGDASPFAHCQKDARLGIYFHGDAAPGAGVRGPALVERDVQTGDARVGPNVYLGAGVVLEDGAHVENAAVFPGTRVARAERLRGVVAWDAQRMGA